MSDIWPKGADHPAASEHEFPLSEWKQAMKEEK